MSPRFFLQRFFLPVARSRRKVPPRLHVREFDMALTIYHNPRCTKSRETLALLEKKGLKPRVVEYLKTPPNASELKNIARMLGLSVRDLVRKSEAVDVGIDPVEMDEKALVAAMVRNPIVIERPIVVNNGKAAIGRPPENVLKIL